MLPHPARDMGHDDMSAFDFDTKAGVGEGLCDNALDFQSFFFLFRHTQSRLTTSSPLRRFAAGGAPR
jgi:hypothetical protein